MKTYYTQGTCSQAIHYEVDDNQIVTACEFVGGCPGNTQAVARLVIGKKAQDVINMLKGIPCGGKATSCPDQLARALQSELNARAS
ncbi:MAG: TIGR03905 family TSCPD domain-containing protein [Kiritimatiellae bacterium]|nr:TIGR03905 family TSCPD domain-containing protein [Kiritimatiellia bacterium]